MLQDQETRVSPILPSLHSQFRAAARRPWTWTDMVAAHARARPQRPATRQTRVLEAHS